MLMHPGTPFKPSKDSENQEVQVSLIDLRQLHAKEQEIAKLQHDMEERQRKIDEYER